jgi:sarcosine oxidase delta subunit
MRSKTTGGVIVSYPDLLLPIFNRGVVKVTNINTEVITTITAKGQTFTDVRQPFEEVVELDVSPYIRVFYQDVINGISRNWTAQIVVKTYINNVETILLEDEFVPIFGASSYIYPLGHSPRQRYYPNFRANYDFIGTKDMFLHGLNYAAGVQMTNGYTTPPFDRLFNGDKEIVIEQQDLYQKTFIEHKFLRDDREDGILITWIDGQGCYRHYVMDEGAVTINAKDKGEDLYAEDFVESEIGSYDIYIPKPQGVSITTSQKFCATFTDEEDRHLLGTLQFSPFIVMRKKNQNAVPIRLKRGSFSNTKGIADVEFEFFLPSEPDMSV